MDASPDVLDRASTAGRRLLRRVANRALGSIVSAEADDRTLVALTFDDGPGACTEAILDLLDHYGARGTFFMVGRKIAARRRLVRQAHEGGHVIGNHTFDHLPLPQLSARVMWREIRDDRHAIEDAIGARVSLFRPPYGQQSLRSLLFARLQGHRVIGWSAAGDDWRDVSARIIATRISADLRPGAIVLLHDDREGGAASAPRDYGVVMEALSLLLDHLDRIGLRSITVPAMLEAGRPRQVAQFGRAASRQRHGYARGGEYPGPRGL